MQKRSFQRAVARAVVTSASGLSSHEVHARQRRFGLNEVIHGKQRPVLIEFLLTFRNPLVFILLGAAVLSAVFGDLASAVIVTVIILLSGILDFANTYKAKKAAELLQQQVMITTRVIRDDREQEIPVTQIVPDDVVLLAPGDVVPADGVIIAAKELFLNESSLTGESFPVEKTRNDRVYMGSSALTGSATLRIEATGERTKYSHIALALLQKDAPTEFDRRLSEFSRLIMKVTFLLVVAVFFVNAFLKHSVFESLLFSIALAVGLTPELLPMIITLNLSKGSMAMAKQGVIVKRLSAIENFGSMDVLCTDKTGTLTEDKIAVVKHINGAGQTDQRVLLYAQLNASFHAGFVSPLDEAIRGYKKLALHTYQKVDEIPFDYARKRITVIVERAGERILVAMGATDELLTACRFYEQTKTPFTQIHQRLVQEQYAQLSRQGFRVLAVAEKALVGTAGRKTSYDKQDEAALTFLGFIALLDPPKQDAADALRLLKKHGVEVKVLTGDNELITQKIALDLALPVKGILLGPMIARLDDQALSERLARTTIFARMTPDQKERVIRLLQKQGHVVGYLGDGVNDAPSLKTADVGISVNNAVDVAKESADLILLRKSLRELTHGVMEGRRTFVNTRKYLLMTLSSNFGNMFSMAGASLFIPFLPMLPTQILLNNLVYDVSQFSLPLDRVDAQEILAPQRFDIRFLKQFMFVFGPLSSLFDFITFFVLMGVFHLAGASFQTGWFLESLATQTLVVHVIRTRRVPFLQSRPSLALMLSTGSAIAASLVFALGPWRVFFGFVSPGTSTLIVITLIIGVYLLSVEGVKRWFYRRWSVVHQTVDDRRTRSLA